MWAFFISIWIPLTAPVNTKLWQQILYWNIYNDHDQIMNFKIPNERLSLTYAPLLVMICISMIILMVFLEEVNPLTFIHWLEFGLDNLKTLQLDLF